MATPITCAHVAQLGSRLEAPRASQQVHREECTQCFDHQDLDQGINVCLSCFNGGCLSLSGPSGTDNTNQRNHSLMHFLKLGGEHALAVNIRRRPRPAVLSPTRTDDEPPLKKLAIRAEPTDDEKYVYETSVRCFACGTGEDSGGARVSSSPHLDSLITALQTSLSSSQRSEVKAWEEEIVACEHTLTLQQTPKPELDMTHCADCELTSNLWLCLSCGNVGCGRQQFGGIGGNGHALRHHESCGHGVNVKLGTIEPEGTADIYCYTCNDAKVDPDLARHLATFNMIVSDQKKTEKSMTELQVEQNLKFDFAMTGEDGKELEPLFGPGLTGLRNLGNSCYMASTLQCLFSLPSFQSRYYLPFTTHASLCANPLPATCLTCQLHKVADGLLSGRYAVPRSSPLPSTEVPAGSGQAAAEGEEGTSKPFQEGIRPNMLKALVGKGHEEFSTMKQQDADEFLRHLLKLIRRSHQQGQQTPSDSGSAATVDPTHVFDFSQETRLSCLDCSRVRYKTDAQDVVSVPVSAVAKGAKGKAATEGVHAVSQEESMVKAAEMEMREEEKGGKVEFEEVRLEECLKELSRGGTVEYRCPACKKTVEAIQTTKFASFPNVLVIHARRFQLVNWVPQKLEIPIIVPDELLLDDFKGTGLQEGEEVLPEEEAPAVQLPEFNAGAMAQLEGMGFPTVRCHKALLATGNSDANAAMEWLFAHMDDADIDEPIQPQSAATGTGATIPSGPEPTPTQIEGLTEMGFTHAQAVKALKQTDLDPARAVEWLFSHPDDTGAETDVSMADAAPAPATGPSTTTVPASSASSDLPARYRLKAFISHKGPSVHSGHYVAHVRFGEGTQTEDGKGPGWVLFNDEKVVNANGGAQGAEKLMPYAYVYVFERV